MRPSTDEAFALVLPEASARAMDLFLAAFAKEIAPDTHVVLVLDQAGWHGEEALVVPETITLLPLPSYSPELNPVEWVWRYLRERYLSHRVYPTYEDIVEAACSAWNALAAEAGRLSTLTAFPWSTEELQVIS